ncbi:DEAD/DEAH box helicase [Crocosphaera watsonii]|uniref:Helicase/UvrB N-terminal domain-containing protein n=2 Tax=Crocosphaera watsonii TaxID=263511 RepID=G5JER6_CROWT|nr:DEAD/DEAH box helicase family protein [Crocosphaera watsonii]EHJ09317.1 hypothetical protein CWATWH0003_B253 [Crocosphaera watsonii WH 0003]
MINNYFYQYHELVLSRILSNQTKLYDHQREALLAIYQKAVKGEMDAAYRQAALVLAGVGTGKTLIQAITPYILAPWMNGEKALFLSDNCTLRERFIKDFPTTLSGKPLYDQWLLYSLEVLPPGVPPPVIVELDANNFESYAFAIHEANLLVANRQFLLNLVNRGDIEANTIGLLCVDEAHFSAAASYRTITNYFENALLTYFTGSKFRSDSQPLPNVRYAEVEDSDEWGNTIIRHAPIADFEFSLQQAWKLNPPPVKRLTLKEATSEAFLVEEEGEEVKYDLETFLAKAQSERGWFRRIIFADSFSLPVLQKGVEILLNKRKKTGQPHAMIVRTLNIPHAHRVAKLLEENFPGLEGKIGLIHSEKDSYDLAGRASDIINKFYDGELWILVHCGMIGVGFDYKWASVSCCLCVLKSLSPAEQEWGRIIRKVPGDAPSSFPQLEHPNWGVVVTHESLQIRPLFQEFLQGKESDIIAANPTPSKTKPVLTTGYEAGETVLSVDNTANLQPGDVIKLTAVVEPEIPTPPKFDLKQELLSTGSLSQPTSEEKSSTTLSTDTDKNEPPSVLSGLPLAEAFQQPPSETMQPPEEAPPPWEKEAEAVAQRLQEIRSVRTVNVQIEAVIDNKRVQITPTWTDLPPGATIQVTRKQVEEPLATFKNHVNLDWQVMVGEELISYNDYKKRVILEQKGLSINDAGEIMSGGISLKQTMPPGVYETFLKGLETELETTSVEVPHAPVIARPDKAKLDCQARYGARIRGLVFDLFKQRYLVPDGANGTSLIDRPVKSLKEAIERVIAKGKKPNFKNNQQLVHSAVFGYIKEKTGRNWNEHNEQQYEEVRRIAFKYMMNLTEQLRFQRKAGRQFKV